MTARVSSAPDVTPVGNGWRVRRPDGTERMVLPRLSGEGWAVFAGMSTDRARVPELGFSGSWRQDLAAAIEWARMDGACR